MVGLKIKGKRFLTTMLLLFFVFQWQESDVAAKAQESANISLQGMIEQANPGDILKIEKGIYTGPIVITKPLKLIAEEGAIIDGNGKGNVVTIAANEVMLKGFTIQNSGKKPENCGILLKEVSDVIIDSNRISNVLFGIYSDKSSSNAIKNNEIESFHTHFSKRGNGIHLFKGKDNVIENNKLVNVQDGIYFDFTSQNKIFHNTVEDSRYGFHFMFSEQIEAKENVIQKNITGLMVMDSNNLRIINNQILNHFHVRAVGVLIYDAHNIVLEGNEIRQNSSGLYFEKARDTSIARNLIVANQVGLEFKGENNTENVLKENNFIGNVVQSKIAKNDMRLDDNDKGNYWDDYNSYDLTGDGIGEVPYKAGSIYDQILQSYPHWQFYFESPAIKIWGKAESMFPSIGTANVYDEKPLIEPVNLQKEMKMANTNKTSHSILLYGLLLTASAIIVILKGRRMR